MAARNNRNVKGVAGAGKAQPPATGEEVAPASGDSPSDLLDIGQAIVLLKTTRTTLYRWLREGRVGGMKVGRQWRFYRREIERFLKGEEPRIELRADITPLLESLVRQARAAKARALNMPDQTEIQRVVKLMLELGVALDASDIHLAPHLPAAAAQPVAMLRYRVGGVLQPMAEIDLRLLRAIVGQWKSYVACDPKETRPQDGRMMFDFTGGGQALDVRVCFLTTGLGDSLTARFLPSAAPLGLEAIDFVPHDRAALVQAVDAPWGLIVVTGPTGSGKMTTVYACLARQARPEQKVITIEDPIRYFFPWMTQIAMNNRESSSFAYYARAMLRSDPDVMLIGELRNGEDLHIAQAAALTGHLVLTTLHADETARALVRMVEMGAPPFVVGDATKLVLSQRLVRMLCPNCAKVELPPPGRLAQVEELARTGGLDWDALPRSFRRPAGCERCRNLGYRGRTVLAEALEVTPEIGQALRGNATVDELRTIAVSQGMTTMVADGVRRAAAGQTTLDEVFRTLAFVQR